MKNLQLEKQKLQELIKELKQAITLSENDKATAIDKLKARQNLLHQQNFQLQALSLKASKWEMLVADYKALTSNLDEKIQTQLAARSAELDRKLEEQVQAINVNLDPATQAHLMLREEMVASVRAKERELAGSI